MINTNLIVHGVPAGHRVWGEDSFEYINRFYTLREIYKDVSFVLLVETQNENNKLNNYYTFILTENVVAKDNRPGSYLGITLRIEEHYCRDVYTLYKLFQIIFNEYALNHVIKKENNSYSFLVSDFEEIGTDLSELTNAFLGQITNNFKNDFDKITLSKNKQYNTCVYYNVDDVNSRAFFDDCNLFGKVLISAEYPSKGAIIANIDSQYKKYNAELTKLRATKDELTAECGKIPGLESQIIKLNKSLQSNSETIEKHEEEDKKQTATIQSLQGEVSSLKIFADKDAVANKTYEKVCGLYEKIPEYFQEVINAVGNVAGNSNRKRKKNLIFGFDLKDLVIGLLAFTTCIFVALWYFSPSPDCNHEDIINELRTDNSKLKKEVQHLKQQISNNNIVQPMTSGTTQTELQNVAATLSVTSIINDQGVTVYTISADNYQGPYYWKFFGYTVIDEKERNNQSIKIIIDNTKNNHIVSLYRTQEESRVRDNRLVGIDDDINNY